MGQIAVMGNKKTLDDVITKLGLDVPVTGGDTKIIWTPDNEVEVNNARRTFAELRERGYATFSVRDNGERNERVAEFDPHAEKLIFVPPMMGG